MTSFTSNSSFGGRSSFSEGSDLSTSPNFSRMPKFDEMRRDGPMQAIEDEGALTHPVLSSFNRDVVVAGEFGLAKMQVRRPRTGWLSMGLRTALTFVTPPRHCPSPTPLLRLRLSGRSKWLRSTRRTPRRFGSAPLSGRLSSFLTLLADVFCPTPVSHQAKKDARKAKHAKKVEPPPQTKAMKKAKKHMGEMDDGPDDDL